MKWVAVAYAFDSAIDRPTAPMRTIQNRNLTFQKHLAAQAKTFRPDLAYREGLPHAGATGLQSIIVVVIGSAQPTCLRVDCNPRGLVAL